MTDQDKPASPAVAPAREVSVPLTSWVRGGTLSSQYEQNIARQKHEAEERRKAEAARQAQAKADPAHARIGHVMGGNKRAQPHVVLEIHDSDRKPVDFIVCELVIGLDGDEMTLCMACPYCAVRVGQSEANFKFSNKHKRFELDTRRQGEIWVNPEDPREFYPLAGTIHLTEAVRCPGVGCSWRFKIDNSVVRAI